MRGFTVWPEFQLVEVPSRTLDPKPQTPNPKPRTLNPKPFKMIQSTCVPWAFAVAASETSSATQVLLEGGLVFRVYRA